MRDVFLSASGVPFRNLELLQSNDHTETGQIFPSAEVVRLTKGFFPAIFKVTIPPNGKVVTADQDLSKEMNEAEQRLIQARRLAAGLPETPDEDDGREQAFQLDPIMSLKEHYARYTAYRQAYDHSPHGFPFTIGIGGFLFIGRYGEQEINDPPQFVMKQDGICNTGTWSQPSGLVSGAAFKDLGRHIASQTGIVLLDEERKIASVVALKLTVDCPQRTDSMRPNDQYYNLSKGLRQVDGEAIKRAQLPMIMAELAKAGYGDYKVQINPYTARLMREKLPPLDKLTLTLPVGSHADREQTLDAFVVKDHCGSVKINLPFCLYLPEDQKILTIDCEGKGREADLKTQDELLELQKQAQVEGDTVLNKDLTDWLARPQKTNYIPKTTSGLKAATPAAPAINPAAPKVS